MTEYDAYKPAWFHLGFGLGAEHYTLDRATLQTISDLNQTPYSVHHYGLVLPLWFLQILFLIYPVRQILHWRRQRRAAHRVQHGLCPACAYDLRASSERCPECGSPIENDSTPR